MTSYIVSLIMQGLWSMLSMFASSIGLGGIIALVAGGVMLLTLSAKVTKFFGSPRGMLLAAILLVAGLAFSFASPRTAWGGGRSLAAMQQATTRANWQKSNNAVDAFLNRAMEAMGFGMGANAGPLPGGQASIISRPPSGGSLPQMGTARPEKGSSVTHSAIARVSPPVVVGKSVVRNNPSATTPSTKPPAAPSTNALAKASGPTPAISQSALAAAAKVTKPVRPGSLTSPLKQSNMPVITSHTPSDMPVVKPRGQSSMPVIEHHGQSFMPEVTPPLSGHDQSFAGLTRAQRRQVWRIRNSEVEGVLGPWIARQWDEINGVHPSGMHPGGMGHAMPHAPHHTARHR